MKITYKIRHKLTDYTCYDTQETFFARSYFIPEGQSLIYFKINNYDYKAIAKEDIITIENNPVQIDKSEQARRTREEYLRTLKNPGPFAKTSCYY